MIFITALVLLFILRLRFPKRKSVLWKLYFSLNDILWYLMIFYDSDSLKKISSVKMIFFIQIWWFLLRLLSCYSFYDSDSQKKINSVKMIFFIQICSDVHFTTPIPKKKISSVKMIFFVQICPVIHFTTLIPKKKISCVKMIFFVQICPVIHFTTLIL